MFGSWDVIGSSYKLDLTPRGPKDAGLLVANESGFVDPSYRLWAPSNMFTAERFET